MHRAAEMAKCAFRLSEAGYAISGHLSAMIRHLRLQSNLAS